MIKKTTSDISKSVRNKRSKEVTKKKENQTPKNIGRKRWEKDAKKIVIKYFGKHITKKIAPKKEECMEFISLYNNLFTPNDWIRIQFYKNYSY